MVERVCDSLSRLRALNTKAPAHATRIIQSSGPYTATVRCLDKNRSDTVKVIRIISVTMMPVIWGVFVA